MYQNAKITVINQIVQDALSKGYQDTNRSHWNKYVKFCSLYALVVLPATEQTLCDDDAFRFLTSNICGQSLKNKLCGIRIVHIDKNHPLNIRIGVMQKLWRSIRGFEKARLLQKSERKPITHDILDHVLTFLDSFDHDQTSRALLSLAKFDLPRVSEYTCSKEANAPKLKQIRVVYGTIYPMFFLYPFCNHHPTNILG